jgi:hypothetical protein
MKKILIVPVIIGIALSGIPVTYGASTPVRYGESIAELVQAEQRLNKVVAESKIQEKRELESFDERKVENLTQRKEISKLKTQRLQELEGINNYQDLASDETVAESVQYLQGRGYYADEEFVALFEEVETYKQQNPAADIKEVVRHMNDRAGLSEKSNARKVALPGVHSLHAYSTTYEEWSKLTPSEKLLYGSNPSAAVKTKAISKAAFDYTYERFRKNGEGDPSDGYRHAMWNALMTRDINRTWVKAAGDAHEDVPQTELNSKKPDGFYGWQHKNMDLANNQVGRDTIGWYEYWWNCTDATVKSRLAAKMTNTPGNIIWLHK